MIIALSLDAETDRERQGGGRERERERGRHRDDGIAVGLGGGREGGMQSGERWGIVRCADKAIMNPMMLRFRPIAPKPETGGSVSGGSAVESKNLFVTKGRTKRKYVRVRKNNSSRHKKEERTAEAEIKEGTKEKNDRGVTLQLLPEKSESLESGSLRKLDHTRKDNQENGDPPMCMNFDKEVRRNRNLPVAMRQMTRPVESWVTVESVTDTCMDARGLGTTDGEIMKNLGNDTCPGFLSDGLNRVFWVNGAFRKMVSDQNDGQSPELITVWLVAKEKLPYLHTAFTCQVKLQYTWGKNKSPRRMPCDVWRMDGGGFAWRLDVEAALSLGR